MRGRRGLFSLFTSLPAHEEVCISSYRTGGTLGEELDQMACYVVFCVRELRLNKVVALNTQHRNRCRPTTRSTQAIEGKFVRFSFTGNALGVSELFGRLQLNCFSKGTC